MKELEKHISEKTEIKNVRSIEKKHELIKSLRPKKGQKIYEMNLKTMIIKEAQLNREYVQLTKLGGQKVGEIVINKDCIYCAALNFKNADKHFHKMLGRKFNK